MKKSLTLLMLTMVLAMTAQTTTPYYKNIKLSTIPIGTKNDSVVVWNGTTKLLKHIPVSEIKSAPATLQSVLNYNPSATSIDGINTVRILDVMGEQGYGTEFKSSSINGTNIVGIDSNSTYMYSGLGENYAFISLSAGNIVINDAHSLGSTGLEFTEPISNSTLRFPAPATDSIYNLPISVNGNLANAQGEITIPSASFNLEQVITNSPVANLLVSGYPMFTNGDSFTLFTGRRIEVDGINEGGNAHTHIHPDRLSFGQSFLGIGGNTIVRPNVEENVYKTFDFPNKPTGDYIIATEDDVTNIKFASTTTNALIDADLTGKAIITKEYFIDNSGGSVYTVATLPAGLLNDMAIVTDATAPTYLGAVVGGGTVTCPVWYNGTTWVSR